MQEASRRQYLALLGVDLWVPRDAAAAPEVAVPGVAEAPPAVVPAPAETAHTPAVVAVPEPEPATPPPATAPATGGATTEALGCSLLALPDGLLLVAAYLTPQAPGLSGPEHALLLSIASALAPGAALPAPDEFRWPPPGVRLPAVSRPGAAQEALVGLLAEQRRKRQLRDLVLLGETPAPMLQDIAARLGLRLVVVPSLAAMLADAARKRACWDALKPLRRGAPS